MCIYAESIRFIRFATGNGVCSGVKRELLLLNCFYQFRASMERSMEEKASWESSEAKTPPLSATPCSCVFIAPEQFGLSSDEIWIYDMSFGDILALPGKIFH